MSEQAGDWIRIYHETVRPLYAYVSRLVGGTRELAEDLTQETYMRALDRWPSGTRPEDPLAWLKTVARNQVRNHFRQQTARPVSMAELDQLLAQPVNGHAEHVSTLQWGLTRLPQRDSELLQAFYFEGRSLGDLAEERAVRTHALEVRLHRARQALRKKLQHLTRNES